MIKSEKLDKQMIHRVIQILQTLLSLHFKAFS